MTIKLTKRCAHITHERAVRMQAVVLALQERNLTRQEIEAIIGLTSGGATKYLEDLLDNDIIARFRYKGETSQTPRLYHINPDSKRVANFLRQIMAPGLDGLPRHRGRNISAEDGTRKVHIAKDDEPIKVKLGAAKPPKQFDLLLYLFGMNMEVA